MQIQENTTIKITFQH